MFFVVLTIFTIPINSIDITTYAAGTTPDIFLKNSSPYGISYGNWLTKWWQWYIGIPAKDHPNNNPAPQNCALHQQGPVWFLSNLPETKQIVIHNCTVPSGKAIAFTIETGECDLGMSDVKGDNDLVTCASKGNQRYVTLQASVDGIPIPNLEQYRMQSNFFNITIQPDNIYGAAPGTFRAVASGYIIILKPLSSGEHVIKYSDQVNNPFEKQYNHQKSEIYNLLITP
jgi:hypothetical protein